MSEKPWVEERKAQQTESEISVLLSDLKQAYQILKEIAPTIKQGLHISDLSDANLGDLILDLETTITDLEG